MLQLAARFVVPVDPEANLVLLPGVGLCRAFGRVMPTLELECQSCRRPVRAKRPGARCPTCYGACRRRR